MSLIEKPMIVRIALTIVRLIRNGSRSSASPTNDSASTWAKPIAASVTNTSWTSATTVAPPYSRSPNRTHT